MPWYEYSGATPVVQENLGFRSLCMCECLGCVYIVESGSSPT
jgi:hypothetical protein